MIPAAIRVPTRLSGGNRNIQRSLATMTTPSQLFYLSAVVSVFALVSNPGMAATLRVPGDHATIGAAIAAAAVTGDIVEITDSAVYVEDLDIRKAITLRGAVGQAPIIRAANTAERFTHLGIAGADRLGALLRAPGIMVENVAFENLDPEVNSEEISTRWRSWHRIAWCGPAGSPVFRSPGKIRWGRWWPIWICRWEAPRPRAC